MSPYQFALAGVTSLVRLYDHNNKLRIHILWTRWMF